MNPVRQGAAATVRSLVATRSFSSSAGRALQHQRMRCQRTTVLPPRHQQQQQQCRYDSSSSSNSSSNSSSHAHGAASAKSEHFSWKFYAFVIGIPLGLYALNTSLSGDGDTNKTTPLFSRLIDKWTDHKELWETRNSLHTAAIERAAHDRNLFQSERPNRVVDLKFPEIFDRSSNISVPAGGKADLSKVIAHYEKKNREMEEKVRARSDESKKQW